MTPKRVIFCTNSSLYSSYILESILASEQHLSSIEIVGVFLSERVRTKQGDFFSDALRIIKASGIRYAIYLALGTVIFDSCRLPSFRPTLSSICKKHRLELFKSKDINSGRSINWLTAMQPDILFSGFFNQKLSEEVLAIPTWCAVNIHPALLPKYKGVDPVFFYILNDEQELGVTLHEMDKDYDTGKILSHSKMNKAKGKSIFWHNAELFKKGVELFLHWAKHRLEETEADQATDKVKQSSKNTDNSCGAEEDMKNAKKSPESEYYDSWPNSDQVAALKTKLFSFTDFFEQARR